MRAPLRAVTNEAHAAGPHVSKHIEDDDTRRVHEWRRRWRHYMSEAVVYFDDIPREIAHSYKPYLQMLGSIVQPFFDSRVTHVISDRQTGDVVAKAREKAVRVYSSDKMSRFLNSLTGYTPPRTTEGGQAKLDQLLENERRQNTVNAAYARKEANFHTFRGPYILIFDPQQVNRPLAIKEWHPAEPQDGAWPQLRLSPQGTCPFAPKQVVLKASKRRHEERGDARPNERRDERERRDARRDEPAAPEARAKRRALVGPCAPGLAGLGLTMADVPRAVNPLMPDADADAAHAPRTTAPPADTEEQQAASAATEPNDGTPNDGAPNEGAPDATQPAAEQPEAEAEQPEAETAPATAAAAQAAYDAAQNAAHDAAHANAVMAHAQEDKENQILYAAPRAGVTPSMQPHSQPPGTQSTQPTQASARMREFGEIVASGVQRYSQTSTKSFAANVGPSREVANLTRKVLPPAPSRPRAEPKRDRPPKKPGFCENCLERYDDLGEHLKGQSHVMFATNEKRFKPLHEALQRFEQNRRRRRLASNALTNDERPIEGQ